MSRRPVGPKTRLHTEEIVTGYGPLEIKLPHQTQMIKSSHFLLGSGVTGALSARVHTEFRDRVLVETPLPARGTLVLYYLISGEG